MTQEIKSLNAFEKNNLVYRATERIFEIIGEAIKKAIANDDKLQSQDSEKIIGMRNRLAHAYDEVDKTILYVALKKSIPILKEEIYLIIKENPVKI